MIIVWAGWGIMAPLFAVIGAFVGFALGAVLTPLGLSPEMANGFGLTLGEIAAGFGLFFFARAIESKPGRVLVDAATNERIEMRKSAGSFFFIPTRFWAFILPALALVFVIIGMTAPAKSTAEPAPAAASAPPAAAAPQA